jgi:hypothetical protein
MLREYWYQGGDDDEPHFIFVGIPTRTSRIFLGWVAITALMFMTIF